MSVDKGVVASTPHFDCSQTLHKASDTWKKGTFWSMQFTSAEHNERLSMFLPKLPGHWKGWLSWDFNELNRSCDGKEAEGVFAAKPTLELP